GTFEGWRRGEARPQRGPVGGGTVRAVERGVRRGGTTPRRLFPLLRRGSAETRGRCRRAIRTRFPGLGAPAPPSRRPPGHGPAGRPTRPAGRSERDHTADRWVPP